MRSLILDGHSRAAIESAQALGRVGVAVDVAAGDPGCLCFRSRYVHNRFVLPAQTNAEFLEWIARIQTEHRYDLVIPSTEVSLRSLMALPEGDEIRQRAVLSSNASLEIALNKEETNRLAAQLGISIPASVLYTTLDQVLPVNRFPVVLKPLSSKVYVDGRLQTFEATVVSDENKRAAVLGALLPHTPVQEQEYIRGTGVGIELLFSHGRKQWHFAHERVHEFPLTGGASTYRRSMTPPPRVLRAAETLLEALEWHGVAMVEFKMRQDGAFWLMEINPRLWGSLALSIDAGVNFPLGLLLVASVEKLPPQPAFKAGYYTRYVAGDLEWLKDNFRADHSNRLLLTRPRLASFLEYLRPLIGRESWDHFDVHDLGVTFSSLGEAMKRHANLARMAVERRTLERRVRAHHAEVLRAVTGPDHAPRKILFVCFGNMCRSPFAESVARQRLPACIVESAGLSPREGMLTPTHVRAAAAEKGIDLSRATSQRVTAAQVEASDLILLMDLDNYRLMAAQFPAALSRTTMLGLFAPEPVVSIPDPYRMPAAETDEVLQTIESAIDGLTNFILRWEAESAVWHAGA